ncbi:MAG: bestrophin family ion channel [Bacteroidota bacterium]
MIVKRNFHPARVWAYIRRPMWIVMIWSSLIWGIQLLIPAWNLALSFSPIGILGSALAIFIAFRNNAAYARWWEASQIWEGIVNASRVLARLVITFTDSHAHQENYDAARSEAFKRSMVRAGIAWAHALRFHLRGQDEWERLKSYLPQEDYNAFLAAQNKPNYLQLLMGKRIYIAMGNGTLGGFDSFQMEGQLLALAKGQGAAERIKHTPLPRQYDFFTRLFVLLFSLLLPFGLLSLLPQTEGFDLSWLIIPLSILLAGVFVIMERTGAANEAPFENKVTDVPLTALCNTIERDLMEMLGEKPLPEKMQAVNGYLF